MPEHYEQGEIFSPITPNHSNKKKGKENMQNANTKNVGAPNVERVAEDIINAEWCINCIEEAIHFIEMSGLQGELMDAIQNELQKACSDDFSDKLQAIGVWDGEIDILLSSRHDFTTFDMVSDYIGFSDDIGSMTLGELESVQELCKDQFLMVDGQIVSLMEFLNLESITVDAIIDMQDDWNHAPDDPIAWHLIESNNLDFFFDVYGEEGDGQWVSPEWDGSKRIAPEARKKAA